VANLPVPEQWVLARMNEMQLAEMIEEHIDYVDKEPRSVHLPTPFVRHYLQRDDLKLPTVVAIATLPIVLADGGLLAPDGLDRTRGIIFKLPREVRAIIPRREGIADKKVQEAMRFLCDEWLCDLATDYAGKCTMIAAALTIIERSMLPDRPAFFVTAGRRGGGKTTALIMLIMAVTGIRPAAAAWSSNEEERRKALLSYFLYGVPYILWDNIPRGTQISCPHIEKSCTAAFYSDRKLGLTEMVLTAVATIHMFTGNNIGPRGDLASRSLHVRLHTDRPDPENRDFKHPDPITWTENNRAEIMAALYTILLGNPMLKAARDAALKTRFKMWWRLVGSAVEHAAKLHAVDKPKKDYPEIDFKNLFLDYEENEDEESISLADALRTMFEKWPAGFHSEDVAALINDSGNATNQGGDTLRNFLYPGAQPNLIAAPRSVGKLLKARIDEPVKSGEKILILKKSKTTSGPQKGSMGYHVKVIKSPA
jgi:hypothetical protein